MSWGPRPSPIHPTLPWVLHAINNCLQKPLANPAEASPRPRRCILWFSLFPNVITNAHLCPCLQSPPLLKPNDSPYTFIYTP